MLEILNEVIKEKLDLKRELTITNIEIREVPRSLSKEAAVAVTFMDKLDKEAIVKRVETLEKSGIKVWTYGWMGVIQKLRDQGKAWYRYWVSKDCSLSLSETFGS